MMSPIAAADAIRLSSGRTLEGIATRQTSTHVTVQVSWQGVVTFEAKDVASIERSSEDARQRLRAAWRATFDAEQQRQHAQEEFEADQKAHGLVQYRGEWVTAEELAFIKEAGRRKQLEARQRQEQMRRDEEVQRLLQQVRALEAEQQRLREELARERWRARERVLIVHPRVPHVSADQHLKDEHGNLVRLQTQDGRQFITTTDGRSIDVTSHEGHRFFADATGAHHDLTPFTAACR